MTGPKFSPFFRLHTAVGGVLGLEDVFDARGVRTGLVGEE
jgi:hypothetical protein